MKNQATQPSTEPPRKRISINNTLLMSKTEDFEKYEQIQSRPLDKKMYYQEKQYKFQPFDLRELESNTTLIKNNRYFATMLDSLKRENQKIIRNEEKEIVNYKLYDFFYTTLLICNNKTESQVEVYLQQVEKWFKQYSYKRDFFEYPKHKNFCMRGEDDLVRQSYKSTLPLEIEQYQRKFCTLPAPKSKNAIEMGQYLEKKGNQFRVTTSDAFSHQQSQFSGSRTTNKNGFDYTAKSTKKSFMKQKQQELELPNLKSYRMQALRMKKLIEERQEKALLQSMKKNQARIQTQTSNNFFKPLLNRRDLYNKTTAVWQDHGDKFKNNFSLTAAEGFHQKPSQLEPLQNKRYNKENYSFVVNSTAAGFYQIKKSNLNKLMGLTKSESMAGLSKFLNNSMFENQNSHIMGQNEDSHELVNIEGFNLMKNPYDVIKSKKKK